MAATSDDLPVQTKDSTVSERETSSPVNTMEGLLREVLPSLLEARPAWAAAGVTWSYTATDILCYLLEAHPNAAVEVATQHVATLLTAHVNLRAAERLRGLCQALVRFAERADTPSEVVVRLMEALVAVAEQCMAGSMPHLASFIIGHVSTFTATRASIPRALLEKILALVQTTLAATDAQPLTTEQAQYSHSDIGMPCGVKFPSPARAYAPILRDMAFAAYSLVGGARDLFNWRAVAQLELEFLVSSGNGVHDLAGKVDQVWVVRQKPVRAPAFVAECRQAATAYARAGYFAAASQFIRAALTGSILVAASVELDKQLLEGLYVALLSAAEAGYGSPAANEALAMIRSYGPESGRLALAVARQTVRDFLADETSPRSPTEVQADFTHAAMTVVRGLVDECISQLHPAPPGSTSSPAPCTVALIGLGSMAHASMALYSDLEFAMVTSEPFCATERALSDACAKVPEGERAARREQLISVRDYVIRFVHLLELKVVALGETPPMVNVQNVQGLSFDSGGNTPLIKDPPLAGTAEQLAEQLRTDASGGTNGGGDLIVIGVLAAPCLLAGDAALFNELERARREVLGPGGEGASPRVRHGVRILQEALAFRLHDRLSSQRVFDAKKTIYRMPSMALAGLALLFEVERPAAPLPLTQLVAQLVEQGALHPRIGASFTRVLATAARLRLGAHAAHGTENDTVAPSARALGNNATGLVLSSDAFSELQRLITETIIPLGAFLADYTARVTDILARRERGATVELERGTDVTRWFDAGIQEKIAAISRRDGFSAAAAALTEKMTRGVPEGVDVAAVVAFLQAAPLHPAMFATLQKCDYLEGITRQRASLATLIEQLARVVSRGGRVFLDETIASLRALDEQYQQAAAAYQELGNDEAARAELSAWPVQAVGAISGARTLRGTVAAALFDAKDGSFVNTVTSGMHDVNHRVPGLHFKRDPAFPSVEYAVSLLGFLLDVDSVVQGKLTPPTELMRVVLPPGEANGGASKSGASHVLLASQTVAGMPLHKALVERPTVMSQWRPAHYTLSFILALLVCPEDGKPDNFIVVDNLDADGNVTSVDVVSIDNDHSFVTPFTPKGYFSGEKLFIKSIIFCADQMKQPLDAGVRARLAQLQPADILRHWLLALCRSNTALAAMLTTAEMEAILAGGKGPCIPFLMSTPIIKGLYERLARMIGAAAEEGEVTHLDVLRTVLGRRVAETYELELNANKSAAARFLDVTKGSYKTRSGGVGAGGGGQTLTTSAMMLSSNLGVTTMKNVRLDNPDFSPQRALESLQLIDSAHLVQLVQEAASDIESGRGFNRFHRLALITLQERVFAQVDWGIAVQRSGVKEELQTGAPTRHMRHLTMTHMGYEGGRWDWPTFFPLLPLDSLVHLDLSETRIESWDPLPSRCTSLRTLVLRHCLLTMRLNHWSDFPALTTLALDSSIVLDGSVEIPNRDVDVRCDAAWLQRPEDEKGAVFSITVVQPVKRVIGGAKTERVKLSRWNHGHPCARELARAINVSLRYDIEPVGLAQERLEAVVRLLEEEVGADIPIRDHEIAARCRILLRRLAYYNPGLSPRLWLRAFQAISKAWSWCRDIYPAILAPFVAVLNNLMFACPRSKELSEAEFNSDVVKFVQEEIAGKRALAFGGLSPSTVEAIIQYCQNESLRPASPTFFAQFPDPGFFRLVNQATAGALTELREIKNEYHWEPFGKYDEFPTL